MHLSKKVKKREELWLAYSSNFLRKPENSDETPTGFDVEGQLISKWFLGSSISSKKTNGPIRLYCYGTSSQLVFVRFLEEIDDPKKPFRN